MSAIHELLQMRTPLRLWSAHWYLRCVAVCVMQVWAVCTGTTSFRTTTWTARRSWRSWRSTCGLTLSASSEYSCLTGRDVQGSHTAYTGHVGEVTTDKHQSSANRHSLFKHFLKVCNLSKLNLTIDWWHVRNLLASINRVSFIFSFVWANDALNSVRNRWYTIMLLPNNCWSWAMLVHINTPSHAITDA